MSTRGRVRCENCPLRELSTFRELNEREVEFMNQFKRGELVVDPGATILLEGSASPHIYTILEGWAYRHKEIDDGRLQVLNFALPGELIGLQIAIMNDMQHTVTALTRVRLCVFQRDKVWSVYQDHPALAYAMTWVAAREEQLLDGHLLSIGQRSAIERTAYLALHLYDRAAAVGYAKGDVLPTPFSRSHFADAIGVTSVHLSRTLRRLRSDRLMLWQDGEIQLLDRKGMEALSSYESTEGERRPLI